jgi:hypothetical protein
MQAASVGSAAAAYLLDDGTQWGASPPVKVSFLTFFLGCQIHLMVQISPLQCLYSAASHKLKLISCNKWYYQVRP